MNKSLIFLALFSLSSLIYADADYSLRGFLTANSTISDSDCGFCIYNNQSKGATKSVDFTSGSLAGVQFDYLTDSVFSFTAQAVSKKNIDGNYAPEIEWLYLKAKPNEHLEFKAGRLRIPLFMTSEYLYVGYAKNFAKSPVDLYGLFSFSHYDGASATFETFFDDFSASLLLGYGETQPSFKTSDMKNYGKGKDIKIATFTLGNDIFSARFAYIDSIIDIHNDSIDTLFDTLDKTPYAFLNDKYSAKNKKASYYSLGYNLQYKNFLSSGEFGKRISKTYVRDTYGWYVSGALRVDAFTPYIIYSQRKTDGDLSDDTLPDSAEYALLESSLNSLINQNSSEKTITLGTRYELMKNAALKFEWNHIMPDSDSKGVFEECDADNLGKAKNIFTITYDMVF